METEIKPLVYRDRAENKNAAQARRVINKRLMSVAAVLFAVVIAGAVMLTIGIRKNSDAKALASKQTVKADMSDAGQLNDVVSAIRNQITVNSAKAQNQVKTANANPENRNHNKKPGANRIQNDPTTSTAVISSVASNVGFEESIMLMLLSDLTENQEDDISYIPATMGQHEAELDNDGSDVNDESGADNDAAENGSDLLAFENEITAAADSRLDAVAEVAALLTGPDDLPSGLTYKYNEDMQLSLTSHEVEVLERIVEAEATGMSVYGKMLVANVVINRVNSRYFAGDVESVVFQKIGGSYQFAPVKDGRYYSVTVTGTTKEAVERVLSGEDYSQGALYFFQRSATSKTKATWFDRNLKFLFKFGSHEFFTEYKK